MNFIVVGCGRVGAELCYRLFRSGHQVVVVDSRKESFNRLHPDLPGRTLEGEGIAESVLERAGIREAQGLAAVTNSELLMNPSHKAVYSPGNGEVEVYEIVIPDTWEGHTLGELLENVKHCYPVAL